MKIIVSLSALVLIVSLWGCSSKSAKDAMSGECAGVVGLSAEATSTSAKRNVSSTTCGQAAMNISPATN